jgi:hypothetical protein
LTAKRSSGRFEIAFQFEIDGQKILVDLGELAVQAPQLQMSADAGAHLGGIERLDDIVDCPKVKAEDFVLSVGERRHKDNWGVAGLQVRLEPPAGFETADPGHLDVQQD